MLKNKGSAAELHNQQGMIDWLIQALSMAQMSHCHWPTNYVG
jgi:hypothetical protein